MFDIFIRTPSLFPLHSSRPEPNRELKHIIYITVFKIQGLAQRELLLLTPFDFSTGSTGLGPGANTYNIQCTGARSTRATPLTSKTGSTGLGPGANDTLLYFCCSPSVSAVSHDSLLTLRLATCRSLINQGLARLIRKTCSTRV